MSTKRIWIVVSSLVLLVLSIHFRMAAQDEKPRKYVGVVKCMICHKSEQRGNQFGQWESTAHAKAFTTLATDKAREVALGAGIDGDPQEAGECLICHVTAYEVAAELKEETLTREEGVNCEACHGPGSEYRFLSVKTALKAGDISPESVGMIVPDEELCKTCHNEKSPTFKGFNYKELNTKILHPVPEAK